MVYQPFPYKQCTHMLVLINMLSFTSFYLLINHRSLIVTCADLEETLVPTGKSQYCTNDVAVGLLAYIMQMLNVYRLVTGIRISQCDKSSELGSIMCP